MTFRKMAFMLAFSFAGIMQTLAQDCCDSVCTMFDCCRPDGHAPLGIMTDHIHGKGEWTITYSYMNMAMKGNCVGQNRIDDNSIFVNYMMAPNTMQMQMHMLMGMYGISDRLTVMTMFTFLSNDMNMNMSPDASSMNMPGMNSATPAGSMNSKTSGISDTKLYALYRVMEKNKQRIIVGLGISLPTGSVTQQGTNLLGTNQRLAYPMQLGTGTYDLLPNLTYIGQLEKFSWGGFAGANIKILSNSESYNWGNEYNVSGWIAYKWLSFASSSLRFEGIQADAISGYDKNVALLMYNDPNSNASNYGGQRANIYLGLNFYIYKNALKGVRLLVEYGIPVYQNLNGPQMSLHNILQAGIQYTF